MIDDTILFCGYNSRNSTCTIRNSSNIANIIHDVAIKKNFGISLNYKVKYNIINTRTNIILSGDLQDNYQSNNDMIVKIVFNNLKTYFNDYRNYNIFNKPKIIYLYKIEDYIYFIFTEEIIYNKNNEYLNFDKRIPRIGRFCQNDPNKLISTIIKFRLSCKQYYNNIINADYYDTTLYVVFHSGIYDRSIICLFSTLEIETIFDTKSDEYFKCHFDVNPVNKYIFSRDSTISPYFTYDISDNPKKIIVKNKHSLLLGFDYTIKEYEISTFLNYLVLINNITISHKLNKLVLYENNLYALSNNYIFKITSLNKYNNNCVDYNNIIINIITIYLLFNL